MGKIRSLIFREFDKVTKTVNQFKDIKNEKESNSKLFEVPKFVNIFPSDLYVVGHIFLFKTLVSECN